MHRRVTQAFALDAAVHAAAVANYCDHVEHNEGASTSWVVNAGERLQQLALDFASSHDLNLIGLYGARLDGIEQANVLHHSAAFSAPERMRTAFTWRDLQLIQIEHD